MKIVFFSLIIGFLPILMSSCKNVPPPDATEIAEEADEYGDLPELTFPEPGDSLPVSAFPEVWAYVVAGREAALGKNMPITDIGYFAADVSTYGKLIDVPNRRNLSAFSGKVHLVAKCDGRALSHFVLLPGTPERKALIADLIAATKDFDGLQIDFENVPAQAGENFFTFLSELRAGLDSSKMFTVAFAARTRKLNSDVYDYERVLPLVDRILVMAYDEHWSGSRPGPIASMEWGRRVAAHGLNVIGKEKLIMGIPFYGRAWARPNHHSAYVYSGIQRIIDENNVTNIRHEDGIPTFDYDATIQVSVYYEDAYSLSFRMNMYRSMGVAAIGFWRLGQETPDVWNFLKISR